TGGRTTTAAWTATRGTRRTRSRSAVTEPAAGAGARRPGAVGARRRAPVALAALVAGLVALVLAVGWLPRAFPADGHDDGSYADAIPVAANEHEGRLVPVGGVDLGAC